MRRALHPASSLSKNLARSRRRRSGEAADARTMLCLSMFRWLRKRRRKKLLAKPLPIDAGPRFVLENISLFVSARVEAQSV